jgi:hypothetical protein
MLSLFSVKSSIFDYIISFNSLKLREAYTLFPQTHRQERGKDLTKSCKIPSPGHPPPTPDTHRNKTKNRYRVYSDPKKKKIRKSIATCKAQFAKPSPVPNPSLKWERAVDLQIEKKGGIYV